MSWSVNMIPLVSDEEIAQRLKTLHCVVRDEQALWWEVDLTSVDPRKTAFLWDISGASPIHSMPTAPRVIKMIHSFGAPAFFKPSVAECLAQLPELVFSEPVVTFGLVHKTNAPMTVDNAFLDLAGNTYHLAGWSVWSTPPLPK